MNLMKRSALRARTIAAGLALTIFGFGATPPDEPSKAATNAPRPSVEEARERARLLHGTIHDTLQIVHSRYYREDEGLTIPAATLKEVFKRLAERRRRQAPLAGRRRRAMNIDQTRRMNSRRRP